MFQTSLAAALLAASTGSTTFDSPLDLMPADAHAVFALGDFTGHLEAEEPAAWIAIFVDERLREMLVSLGEEDEDAPTEAELEGMGAIAASIRGGAAAFWADEDEERIVLALDVTDDFLPTVRALVEANDDEMVESDVLGVAGHRMAVGTSDEVAMVEIDGTMFIGGGDWGEIEADLRGLVDAMENGDDAPRWWSQSDVTRVADPLIEVFVDFDVLAEQDPELAEMLAEGTVGYFGVGVGEGQEGEIVFGAGFEENDALAAFAGSFGEVDVDLMRIAPPDSFAVSALNVDVNALISSILDLADDPEASGMYEAGLEAGSATLGVDIEDEILGNMSGDVLIVQWPSSGLSLTSEDPEDLLEAVPAFAIAIEDSEPFYTMFETLEIQLGPDGVEVEETSQGTTWTAEPMPGIRLAVGLSETMVFLGAEDRVEDLMDRAAGEVKAGLLDKDQLEFARDNLGGVLLGVQTMEPTWEILETALDMSGEEIPDELMTIIDVLSDHLTGFAFTEFRFTASETAIRMITR